jgi:hypothetical protein
VSILGQIAELIERCATARHLVDELRLVSKESEYSTDETQASRRVLTSCAVQCDICPLAHFLDWID